MKKQVRTSNYKCVVCNKAHYQRPSAINKTVYGLTCSKECGKINRSKHTTGKGNHQFGLKGSENASFKNITRKISNYGYVLIYKPEHIYSNHAGYVFEHILVMENNIERILHRPDKRADWEICHHINRDKTDNSILNLQLMTLSEHVKLHNKEDGSIEYECKILTNTQIDEILAKYDTGTIKQYELAEMYKVSKSTINRIIISKKERV